MGTPIPIGWKYTVTMAGKVVKNVTCARCKCEYVYIMQREVSGEGNSLLWADNEGAKKRAAESAQEALANRLKDDCDYVGCPDCGNYQPNMIRKKRIRRIWAVVLPWLLLCFIAWAAWGFPSHHNDYTDWAEDHWMLMVAGAIVLVAIGLTTVLMIDPNKNPELRIVREYTDTTRALRKADFDAMVAEQQRQEQRDRQAAVSLRH